MPFDSPPRASGPDTSADSAWRLSERLLLACALAVVVLLVYGRTLGTPLSSDARFLTYQNEWVRSGSGLLRFWTEDAFAGAETHAVTYISGYYRPILNTLFWLEYRWAGRHDLLYNLGEVLLHAVNALLVVLLATRVARSRWAGLAAGLLFAIHPVHAFAATEPAARGDVLFSAFYLGGMLLFLRTLDETYDTERPSGLRLAAVAALYLLGLLSKEMGITLPAALVLLVLLRHAQEGGSLRRWRWTLPAWGALGLYFVVRFGLLGLQPSTMGYSAAHGTFALVLAALKTIPVHLARILIPAGPAYPELNPEMLVVVGRGLSDPLLWAAVGILLLIGLSIVRWRREPVLAFWACFFLVAYTPLLSLDNIAGTLGTDVVLTQERWIYLPSVALLSVLGVAVVRGAHRVPIRWLVPAGAAVGCLLAWEASVHAGKHEDPFARLRRLYAIPEQYLNRFELANRYLLYADWVAVPQGDLADAEARARAALELVPDSPITAEGLATIVAHRGGWQEVRDLLLPWMYPTTEFLAAQQATNVRVYDDWMRINPQVVFLLGRAQGNLGDADGAAALLCDALRRGVPGSLVTDAAEDIAVLQQPLTCPAPEGA